jgi:type II secretory pathway predicted ATPase ExeA
MYLEHFQLTHSPFAEEPDPEVFFPGARREEICQSLILDVLAGKQLIKLVGREGSGKTLLWRMMADRLPSEYEVIFLDSPTGSLDDLLRIICVDLGMDPRTTEDDVNYLEVLHRLLKRKRSDQVKVVLVIDEAEKLFLATLERLLLHIGDREQDFGLTTILVGRPVFETNLEQLSVFCAAIDIHAGYFLEELTESETLQYIRYRLNAAGIPREQYEDIFTEGAAAKIFEAAQGNLRMTNILAEETLRASCAEKSFMVLLDRVEPEMPESEPAFRLENKVLELYELLRYNRFVAGALVGAVVAVLLTGFLLMGNSGGKAPPADPTPGSQEASLPGKLAGTSGEVAGALVAAPPGFAGVSPSSGEAEKRDGAKLFRERLAASASWLTGMHKGKYTVQLMMLVSNQAQASIADTLAQDDYYQIREQLYIFRKKTTPPTIFVFHGMYDSLDAAREARNNMPVFLRKHHPYPLAVDDALKKLQN